MVRGFIEQDPLTRQYKLGMQLTRLGHIAERQSEIGRVAGSLMRRLTKEANEAAYISRLTGDKVMYLIVSHTQEWERLTAEVGETYEAWSTASGRLLLAEKRNEEIDAMFPEVLPQFRDRSRITRDRLKAELAEIRKTGYAKSIHEEEHEVFSYAAPIFDGSGRAYMALAVSGPTHRPAENRGFIPLLLSTADQISYRIGGNRRLSRLSWENPV